MYTICYPADINLKIIYLHFPIIIITCINKDLRENVALYVIAETRKTCINSPCAYKFFTSNFLIVFLQRRFDRSNFSALTQTLISESETLKKLQIAFILTLTLCIYVYVWAACEVKTCSLSALLLVWNRCLLVRAPFDRATIPSNLTEETLTQKERKRANVLTLWVCVQCVCMCKGMHTRLFAFICLCGCPCLSVCVFTCDRGYSLSRDELMRVGLTEGLVSVWAGGLFQMQG